MSSHGGARRGAGRPIKWSISEVIKIGQACEAKWRGASESALQERLAARPYADRYIKLTKRANSRPVAERAAWLESKVYGEYVGDLEDWLHKMAEQKFDYDTGEYDGIAPRIIELSIKPPRGTRKRIVSEVAEEFQMPEKAVDNIWQEYRRFEQDVNVSIKT